MSDVLVVLGHPSKKSYCVELANEYIRAMREEGVEADLLLLSELDFDPILHQGYTTPQPLEADLIRAQEAIKRARHVVWVYPMWWVGSPALLKGFIDRTFLPGWAFSYGEKAIPTKLLEGRSARIILTMDSPHWWYRFNYRSAATHSFRRGTLLFSGFHPVKTTNLYHIKDSTPVQRQAQLKRVRRAAHKDAHRIKRSAMK